MSKLHRPFVEAMTQALHRLAPERSSSNPCHLRNLWFGTPFLASNLPPLPIPNLWKVLAVSIDVLLVPDQLVFELLLQVNALLTGLRHTVDDVDDKMERSRSFSTVMSKGVVIVPSSL